MRISIVDAQGVEWQSFQSMGPCVSYIVRVEAHVVRNALAASDGEHLVIKVDADS